MATFGCTILDDGREDQTCTFCTSREKAHVQVRSTNRARPIVICLCLNCFNTLFRLMEGWV